MKSQTPLDNMLADWARSCALPAGEAEAIRAAARSTVATTELPPAWWFEFTHNWAGQLIQASRMWESGGSGMSRGPESV